MHLNGCVLKKKTAVDEWKHRHVHAPKAKCEGRQIKMNDSNQHENLLNKIHKAFLLPSSPPQHMQIESWKIHTLNKARTFCKCVTFYSWLASKPQRTKNCIWKSAAKCIRFWNKNVWGGGQWLSVRLTGLSIEISGGYWRNWWKSHANNGKLLKIEYTWHHELVHHQDLISELYPETHIGFVYNFFF